LNASAQEIILRLVERKPTTGYFVLRVADLKVSSYNQNKSITLFYTVQALQKFDSGRLCAQAKWRNRYHDLVELLAENQKTLVSLMHVNNEGTVLDLDRIVPICTICY
jgi:cysteine desulfurase